jgi:hypothetical protein
MSVGKNDFATVILSNQEHLLRAHFYGATVFSITTLSIMTLSIMTLSIMTLSIMRVSMKGNFVTLSVGVTQYKRHSA